MAKQRHGCLTAWLILLIIVNSLVAVVYLFASSMIKANLPNAPAWTIPVLAVGCIANVVFAIALFQWKKWGFFGFIGTTILALAINLSLGLNVFQIVLGLLGIVILYAVLQIGNGNKGWPQLE
jgi:hypothetical protein